MQPTRRKSLAVDIASTLGAWLTGQLKIAAILTVIFAVGLALSGMPAWWLVAIICGALQVIPIFGSVVALFIILGVAWFAEASSYAMLGGLGTYVVAQGLEGFYLTPKILGSRLRLPPFIVFLAVMLGGALFGFFGLLLAAPVMAVIMIFWRRARRDGR